MADCLYHADHENRIKNLEVDMKERQREGANIKLWTAIISGLCLCLSTAGSVLGQFLIIYFK